MDPTELMKQAGMTAHDYMVKAKRSIDEVFGEGYAAKHPELVGAFMQTAARDFHTAVAQFHMATAVSDSLDTLSSRIADALRSGTRK